MMNKNSRYIKFIVIKIIRMMALFLGLTLLTFALSQLSPIDPINAYLGADSNASPEQILALRKQWGLDKSFIEQFFHWIESLSSGDFGRSHLYKAPVIEVISNAFKNSFFLMIISWILSGIIGYILGTIAAFKKNTKIDNFIKLYSYTLASTPSNVLGIILLIIFSVWIPLFPVGLSSPIGVYDTDVNLVERIYHFILPCLTLSFLGIANVAMHTREEMLEVLDSEYILFAKTCGENNWELFKNHCFRNTVIPILMIQFSYFSELFGGSALAEVIFAYHGLGSVMTQAGLGGDLPLLLGSVIISSLFVFCGNLIADILLVIFDPRIGREVDEN
ncbi:MAG: ABC transporter permease [Fusobacterium gastrosuis]|uniref:ABC transporter permease n=1 Tax=Fusobacterium gastrosuis TaxID=1755100 RepID=UPI002A9E93E3|nr:ABC transporter permease [Fusobacteriaceae bacterium]MDY5795799.1 ABC transporter permease [Fusobacterium gastrosuis]